MIGLSGAQRCGKTTLAKAYAEKHGIKFLETSASAVFKRMKLDPAVTYDFETRLKVQEEILKEFNVIYASAPQQCITDRTPVDLIAYTMSECLNDNVPEYLEERLDKYIKNCLDSLNRYFSIVCLVQPGIKLVKTEGKAGISKAHIEHISTLCLGALADPRCKVVSRYIGRHILDLQDRVRVLEMNVASAEHAHLQASEQYAEAGGLLH